MRALLIAQLRLVFRGPATAAFALATAGCVAWCLVGFAPLLGDAAPIAHGLAFTAAFGLPAMISGPAITPAGLDPFAQPMPALPVSPRQRLLVNVIVGELLLCTATLAMAIWAPPDVLEVDLPPVADPLRLLAPIALAWVPYLVLGERMGGSVTGPRLLVVGALCAIATCAKVETSLGGALLFALLATPLAAYATRPDFEASARPVRAVGPGLGGLLRSMVLQTGLLALVALVGTAFAARLAGVGPGLAVVVPAMAWVMVTLLPLLPTGAIPGQVMPLTPQILFRLPVSRTRTTLLLGVAGAVRAVVVCGLSAVALSPWLPTLGVTTWLTALAWVATTGAVAGMAAALPGPVWALGVWFPMGAATLAAIGALVNPRIAGAWAVVGAVSVVGLAAGVLLLSSGRLGWTPRRVG